MKGDSKPLHSIVLQGKGKVGQKKKVPSVISVAAVKES